MTPRENVTHWRFRNVRLAAGVPFGIPTPVFETKSREIPDGVCVSNESFDDFLQSQIQVIDGCIDGLRGRDPITPLFCLDCFDASRWEATTEDERIANEFVRLGWSRL